MLKIRMGKIIAYASRRPELMTRAIKEFFGDKKIDSTGEYFEDKSSLFNEWLIFDFRLDSSRNWLTEYYLINPDNLPDDSLSELEQIIQTQTYDLFEIVSLKRGVFINVYGIFSGKKYQVWEKSLSLQAPDQGSFWNRPLYSSHDLHTEDEKNDVERKRQHEVYSQDGPRFAHV